jgi:dTMP kinase
MGALVVVEGLDGAGKRTLSTALTERLGQGGRTIAQMAFPRYETGVYGPLISDALHGRMGDLTDSVYGMAVLFALDRRAAADELRAKLATSDIVIVDRYIASNAAYGAARLGQDGGGGFVDWVRELEVDRFGLPVPALQILLRVPTEVAQQRAARRESQDAARARDSFESDGALQRRCAQVYEELAVNAWLTPWIAVDGGEATVAKVLAAFS